jgi:hypothetical protein
VGRARKGRAGEGSELAGARAGVGCETAHARATRVQWARPGWLAGGAPSVTRVVCSQAIRWLILCMKIVIWSRHRPARVTHTRSAASRERLDALPSLPAPFQPLTRATGTPCAALSLPLSRAHLLLRPVEGEVDPVPDVRHVGHGAVRRAARAEQAHVALFCELKLSDATVHLVRLAEDEVARVCAGGQTRARARARARRCEQGATGRPLRSARSARRACVDRAGLARAPELGESVRT